MYNSFHYIKPSLLEDLASFNHDELEELLDQEYFSNVDAELESKEVQAVLKGSEYKLAY